MKNDPSQGRDWSGFRGPGGMGIAQGANPPLEWDDNTNVAWKTALPGSGASSPIVFGEHIYLTCYTGFFVPGEDGGDVQKLRRHLLALKRDTGVVVWDQAVPAKLPEEERIRDHGFAANTPAADAD
ncbi:MAG: serine/threonine protein kinase, partial [Planctomycetales bacterium]|nr:serine/threonine protein kinase [Planctomycetales bacterium]